MLGEKYTEAFHRLAAEVNAAGLMRRRHGYYWFQILFWIVVTAGVLVGVAVLGDSWLQLLLAAVMGLAMAQLGFLGHEAAHRQVFQSDRWNEWTARIIAGLVTGLSYGWWIGKHNRHHANPNKEREDPDSESGVLSFTPEGTDRRTGLAAKLARFQGYYFPPLLLFEGFSLHVDSVRNILFGKNVHVRWLEVVFTGIRLIGFVAFLFLMLPPLLAAGFILVQVGVFGFLLGGAFSPNHIGMPTVPHDADIDFLRRQVVMSRNVRGGPVVHFLMGGLEYQIEHHLFPRVPRPNLPGVQSIVRRYCREYGIRYTETTLGEAFRTIIAYLNQVGLKNRDAYRCPLVQVYRG
ncbi:fatty acid desaturase family protein [Microbacterium sp.]|uniref:fatty acid desaturase family protein n=1 Tax=Microbacterium sp. TaxID=51671 RepID=UPI002811431A|nr:acyl-CoA desaturase [Microbacterium sp.]